MSTFETDTFSLVKRGAPLSEYAAAKLKKIKGRYVCPYCNSGGHPRATSDSGFSIKGDHFTCFSCKEGGDIFDLAAQVEGIGREDRKAQLEAVASWANIPIDTIDAERPKRTRAQRTPTDEKPSTPSGETHKYSEARKRERAYVLEAQETLKSGAYPEAVAYLEGRGFTLEEAVRLGFGFDPNAKSAKDSAGEWIGGGRLIIPWKGSTYYHIDRAINPDTAAMKYTKPKSDDVGSQPIYNPQALEGDAFFLVEGALDARAVELLGYEAVALGNADAKAVSAYAASNHYRGIVIGFLDDDEAGKKGSLEAAELFGNAGIAYREIDRGDTEGKDAAEMLATDRDALKALLEANAQAAHAELEREREREYRQALTSFRVLDPADVAQRIFTLSDEPETIPTGFQKLDDTLGGGLTRGLYVLGAVSSLGKTTLAVQIADQIAAQGYPVLFVTIEQSAEEIVAKSLSRLMALKGLKVSTSEIMKSKRREYWTPETYALFLETCNEYNQTIAPSLKILEGHRQPTAADISTVAFTVESHEKRPPVVFVDYLQLLAPQTDHDTDKQAIDKNVMSLRQLARDLAAPVFCISSLNRSSYSGSINLDSFKESGAIEYSADVLIGLQPQGMESRVDGAKDNNERKRAADKANRENKALLERDCELVILKQRNGITPRDGLPMRFKAVSSLFEETSL